MIDNITCYAIVDKNKKIQTLDDLGLIGSAAVSYDEQSLLEIIKYNNLWGFKVVEISLK